MGNGPNYSVRIGRTSQKPNEVALNAQKALTVALSHLTYHESERIGFQNLAQVTLKVGDSVELPVFNQLSSADLAAYAAIQ